MPQMFPIMWLLLLLTTSVTLFIMNSTIHFMSKKSTQMNLTLSTQNKNTHNWKW